jgi:stage II sporulation protein D
MMRFVWERISLTALFLLTQSAWAIPIPPSEYHSVRIRVRIGESVARGEIRGFDLRIHETIEPQLRKLAQSAARATEWEFSCGDGRVQMVRLDQKEASLRLKSPVSIESPAGFLKFQGRPFRETLRIHSKGDLCVVVNELDLEKYLDGLVNAEFNAKWSTESIAAQVIAARTYALYQMREARRRKLDFDLDSTIKDQVYDGTDREDFRASRTVEKTRGMVLTLRDAKSAKAVPLKAFYHSTCGGRTELPEKVWGAPHPGFKRRVDCPFCIRSPRYQWDLELTTHDLLAAIQSGVDEGGLPKGWPANSKSVVRSWRLADIRIQERENRVNQVILSWSKGDQQVELSVSGSKFRSWIGAAKVLSTAFHISPGAGGVWRFAGRGYGHGVGLCQWGAKVMGVKGYSMASILKHYYPDALLRKLW